ncbi:MAG TPA: amidohydrolase family protein [Acidimicrobiales bacterium]|nr:amidohydrolase family protein [Acidimicrobiales bacterium]
MGMPQGQPIIDTMIGFPVADFEKTYGFIRRQTKDAESKEKMRFPAEYMFKDVPEGHDQSSDPIASTLEQMDRFNIEVGVIGTARDGVSERALKEHPDRFVGRSSVDPNDVMKAVRQIVRDHEELGTRAVSVFPAGTFPQVPINDAKMYPIYAKCVELGLSVWVNAGIPGPRLKGLCQHVELIDEVMYDFPELTFVTMHGCEPWEELAVKLMLKWPGLHYCTSAFAPKYYPKAVIDYANTRGADKVMYAGYYPMGLSLERIMGDMPGVPLRDHVWPKFLYDNAARVLGLPQKSAPAGDGAAAGAAQGGESNGR